MRGGGSPGGGSPGGGTEKSGMLRDVGVVAAGGAALDVGGGAVIK